MKKILSTLLLCAMVLSLAACGKSAQEQPEAPQQSQQTQQPEAPATPETPVEPEQPSILPTQPGQDVITAPDTTTKVDPTIPQTPVVPETPAAPETPAEPETPVTPETPAEPEAPAVPETPVEPETPVVPETPAEPVAPVEPEVPAEVPTQAGTDLTALVDQIYAVKMPEFMLMTMPVDLADAESTAWLAGVSDPSLLTGAVVSESMMGAQAYSLVLVQVADAARAEEVANMMLQNIDPVKWICVQADDIDAGIKGDLVLFVMIDSQFGMPAADFIAAFSQVMGGLDKELSK